MRDINRIRWRCRRGMRELDVLLDRYMAQRYEQAPAREQADFRRLLDVPDPVLFAWVMGREQVPDEAFGILIERIRSGG